MCGTTSPVGHVVSMQTQPGSMEASMSIIKLI
jgi:hypothetical protein